MMSPIVKVRVMDGMGDPERSVVALSGVSDQQIDEFALTIQDAAISHDLTISRMELAGSLEDIADAYYDVRPPMNELVMRRFATVCLAYLDNGNNTVDVIDNRETLPSRRLETAGPIVNFTR